MKLKTLQQYKKILGLNNQDLMKAFNFSPRCIANYLDNGAPVAILKQLDAFERQRK